MVAYGGVMVAYGGFSGCVGENESVATREN
jgi:hypothetical protein